MGGLKLRASGRLAARVLVPPLEGAVGGLKRAQAVLVLRELQRPTARRSGGWVETCSGHRRRGSEGVPPLEGAVGGLKPLLQRQQGEAHPVPPLEGAVGGLKLGLAH